MSGSFPLKMKEAVEIVRSLGYECEDISPREFYDYMTGETVSGDRITLKEVLHSDFLILHEVVEMSELKKKGITIDDKTVVNCHPETIYEAHFTAVKYEVKHALNKGDLAYVEMRLKHVREWLDDENIPEKLVPRLKSILEKLSENR
ncbi:MAG: hypothetical protein QXI36_07555 [Candidatus Bathyarchaeia archaeon]